MQKKSTDILIIGGGIIGSTIARALSSQNLKITLLEKEPQLGQHTSTRNSSVIHSGIYYSTDSFKAQFCKKGNQQLTQYIKDNKLPLKETGKYLVATSDQEFERLNDVKNQAIENKVDIEWISINNALKREPSLKYISDKYSVLYAPTAKVGCNVSVMEQLEKDLLQVENLEILYNTQYQKQIDQNTSLCKQKNNSQNQDIQIESKFVINCGGLYADKIAKQFGFCNDYSILPFKGMYLQTTKQIKGLKALVYPVPPMKGATVLGVHLTHTIDDHLKLGPNAIPALWREQYENNFSNFSFQEFLEIQGQYIKNFTNFQMGSFYLKHSLSELQKLNKNYVIQKAGNLTSIFKDNQVDQSKYFYTTSKPGIRAQLIHNQTRQLINDFIVEQDQRSMHLLNVVSPGWTCSFAIADHIKQLLQEKSIIN